MADTTQSLYKYIVQRLKASFADEEARAMADRLFEHYLNLTPTQRVMSGALPADENKIPFMEEAVNKLLNQVPLQYILGFAYFMDMELMVNPAVLIPRPETEELVSMIIKHCTDIKADHKLQILDIGTGSGCIAIALEQNVAGSSVTALDFSQDAIKVATVNAAKNNSSVNFILADILDESQWDLLPACDIIVSNPPYVTHAEKPLMQPNVINYEPHTALFVPDADPLVFYRAIMMFAKSKLMKEGMLWLEINEAYGQEVINLFDDPRFKDRKLIRDIFGKYRFVMVRA